MTNGVIGKVTAAGGTHLIASTAFAVCETAAATTAKKAYIKDESGNNAAFTLYKGVTVLVQMKYANSASDPTLSVNGTAAKLIVRDDETMHMGWNTYYSWKAGAVLSFTYDGTNWMISGEPKRAEVMSTLESRVIDHPIFLNSRDMVESGSSNKYSYLYQKIISFTTNSYGKTTISVPNLPETTAEAVVRFYPISFVKRNDQNNDGFVVDLMMVDDGHKVGFYVYNPTTNKALDTIKVYGVLTGFVGIEITD